MFQACAEGKVQRELNDREQWLVITSGVEHDEFDMSSSRRSDSSIRSDSSNDSHREEGNLESKV